MIVYDQTFVVISFLKHIPSSCLISINELVCAAFFSFKLNFKFRSLLINDKKCHETSAIV